MSGWWIAALFLGIIVVQIIAYKRQNKRLRQEISETSRLRRKLSTTRHELAEVNARRKKLLTAATQALVIVESDYTISSANKVAKRVFGKYKKGVSLMIWTRQYQLQELVEQTLQGDKMPPIYFNRDDRYLEARARFIKSAGEVVAVALAIYDITELERLSRARRDFITNISHELRTPLASLQLLIETLQNGMLDENPEMARELIHKIAIQTDTLSQLAQEVLDLSMIESGKAPIKMAPYSLRHIAQNSIDRLLPQARRKGLDLTTDINDDITILADETMVGRVITNLLHNAIKFTESGSVTISARQDNGNGSKGEDDEEAEGRWVTVSVSDTGVGIASGELPRIFERFYKVDRARKREGSGTGLGLAIAKHIVEAHGGHIWAESNGSGATFYFTLPTDDLQ